MFGVLILFFGLMPLILGVYAYSIVRRRDSEGPDDPPPPPMPQAPEPIIPPGQRARTRGPIAPTRVGPRWPTPVRQRR